MRVLLAGATGAIGRRLAPLLLEAGHEVAGITRRHGALKGTGVRPIKADVLDRDAILRAVDHLKFDAVIHQLTSLPKPPVLYSHMLTTNRLRTEGTSTLLAAARLTGAKKFITASVFYGYGFRDHGPDDVRESAPFGEEVGTDADAVNRALLSNEQQVRAFGGVALRYGLFYGDNSSGVYASDWNGVLPLIHYEDAAAAAVLALDYGRPGAAYNIADDRPTSWRELQEAQAIAHGHKFPAGLPSWVLRTATPFAADILTRTSIRLSTQKAWHELGWAPQYPTYMEGLRATVLQH
jgi:nucleoside-diphosphate-sugar epimerase